MLRFVCVDILLVVMFCVSCFCSVLIVCLCIVINVCWIVLECLVGCSVDSMIR